MGRPTDQANLRTHRIRGVDLIFDCGPTQCSTLASAQVTDVNQRLLDRFLDIALEAVSICATTLRHIENGVCDLTLRLGCFPIVEVSCAGSDCCPTPIILGLRLPSKAKFGIRYDHDSLRDGCGIRVTAH